MRKSTAKKTLKSFLENLERPCFDESYIRYHAEKINCLEWLLSYYENKTAATPKELLESLINNNEMTKTKRLEWIRVLYFWINKNEIVGF